MDHTKPPRAIIAHAQARHQGTSATIDPPRILLLLLHGGAKQNKIQRRAMAQARARAPRMSERRPRWRQMAARAA
jgi:hypothetical protein